MSISNMLYHVNFVLPLSTAFTTVPITVVYQGYFVLVSVNVFVGTGLTEDRVLFGSCQNKEDDY